MTLARDTLPPHESSASRLPLHIEISEMLAREIQAGLLPEGARLAPERSMALELGVAVGTLRKALADLAEKGLIERVHGSGNYVRRRDKTAGAETVYTFFRLELLSGGGLPTAQVLDLSRLPKPSDLPAFGTEREGFRIRRLRRLNGIDAALEEIWIDAPEGLHISPGDLSDALYQTYKSKLGFWIARAEDKVSLGPLPKWCPSGFSSQIAGATWGLVERTGHNQNGTSAEISRTWFDPAVVRFVARWP